MLMGLLLLTSCQHKELCYDHHHYQQVRVRFDWSDAPDASPSGMVLYFYDIEGDKAVQRFDLSGTYGGMINVMPGYYHVLCYNNDTEATLFRGISTLEDHQAYTAVESVNRVFFRSEEDYPRPDEAADEDVVASPDMIWGCTEADVAVEEKEGVTEITLMPHEIVAIYTYEIRNVKNITGLESYGGLISGMAHCMNLVDESTRSDVASVPFVSDQVEGNTLRGEFYTFGVTDDETVAHIFTLYVWMRDGQKWYYNFDVAQQIADAEDKKHVYLLIDGLELPTPLNDSGYNAEVDDWQAEEVDVEM
jgi:hypothetical protein